MIMVFKYVPSARFRPSLTSRNCEETSVKFLIINKLVNKSQKVKVRKKRSSKIVHLPRLPTINCLFGKEY